jgi:glycosyltransferase involved in cell wall biosynthesis
MIFNFIKYQIPIWYYNLKPSSDFGYFPTEKQLEENQFVLQKDLRYVSEESQKRDLAWTAFQSGFINKNYKPGLNIWTSVKLPLEDEYLFLRKNFHKAWVVYTLIIRIITFHNPIKEVLGFLKHKTVKRQDFSKQVFEYSDYNDFKSQLINSNPLVSVVIPTLNRYQYLKDVFLDLEKQTYRNFEVIVVDQTDDFKEEFYGGWNFDLKYWFQKEKALWKARNEAIKSAKGELILLYDDDSLVDDNWIEEHLKCLDYFNADLSSGVSLSVVGAEVPSDYSYFKWSAQLDTGNVLLKKEIFYKIGFFDLQFEKQRMGDGEYGLRCYLNGYKNISNYKAKRIHLKVSEGGLRQMGSWDGWRPKKLFGPRPVPSVLYLSRKYFGKDLSRLYLLKTIIPSLVPYKLKKNKNLKVISFFLIPFVFPLICYQIYKSWNLASSKLEHDFLTPKNIK